MLFISFMPEWDYFFSPIHLELPFAILADDKMLPDIEENTILFLLVLLRNSYSVETKAPSHICS